MQYYYLRAERVVVAVCDKADLLKTAVMMSNLCNKGKYRHCFCLLRNINSFVPQKMAVTELSRVFVGAESACYT